MRKTVILLIALFLMKACSEPPSGNEFILFNVNGYSLDSAGELFQFDAIVVSEGKMEATGTGEVLEKNYPQITRRIDGGGRTLLPGIIDAHAHVMGLGIRELDVNLAGIRSLEEVLRVLEEFAEAHPEREWITGRGWNQELWSVNEFPTAADLDRIIPDRPVYLTRVDGHAAWANSEAMKRFGISRETPDPRGGLIHRDQSGDATGIFVDTAMEPLASVIPERTNEELELALELALNEMARYGITSVHDAGIGTFEWNLYKKFAEEGRLKTRIYAMIGGTGAAFDQLASNGIIPGYAEDMLALRSVKISADGALGSRGAALLEDYQDDSGNRGLLFYDQQELNEMLLKGAEAGFQMNIHAIGDAANRQVLDAFEALFEQLNGQTDLRHRIEHAQIVDPEDIPRFTDYHLIASMQPSHATSDMNMAEERVGGERILSSYAWQTFLGQGTVIAGGSDFPVEEVSPFYELHAAVTRQDHEGMPPGGWYGEQRMSRIEALRAFTIDAAYAAHQEEILGTLEPGKWADFILTDQDYFDLPASDIWKINVLETWVGGTKVYENYE